ncbi:MAG: type II toxin-antitoxin system HipA family toxin [Crocinitomicaceae bacterium]|nr:type II toxin-antitoxin system HipA family toxin [Crocinitomicaceae bacterium]MDG1776763.1 type II toxin-antitoxin system HipA family toxin [Crocinitomicaceae bacterium]
MSSAKITIWDKIIGYIYWDDKNQSVIFEADEEYLQAPFNIAPIIHENKAEQLMGQDFHGKFNGLIPPFNDSLPDAFGNIVFKEWLEQNEMDQSDMNPVERLLYVGKRGIGALEYHESKDIPNTIERIDLKELSQVSDKIIKRKYEQEDYLHNPESLKNILTIGSSVGGAQAKILIAITKEGKLLAGDLIHHQPVDYYIVKLEHDPQNIWNREKNYVEYVYNQIASDIGINVAESILIHEGGRAHFASKRFDRVDNQKIHKQTVNALVGFFGKNHEFSYENIFKIIEYLGLSYSNSEQLFMQMVFNVVASNRDDHTKNFSFLMNQKGEWSLSPAYDLTFPFDPYLSFVIPHQISINGKNKGITREDVETVAQRAGIRNYNQIIEKVIKQVSTFSERIKAYNLNARTIELIVKDLQLNITRMKK